MSTNAGLIVCEGKKMNNKYQQEIYTNSSIHNPFLVTNFIAEMWKITMLCALTEEQMDDWIVECVDYPQAENQSLCAEVNSYLCLKYFLKKEE